VIALAMMINIKTEIDDFSQAFAMDLLHIRLCVICIDHVALVPFCAHRFFFWANTRWQRHI
jgi:hypothetical protein